MDGVASWFLCAYKWGAVLLGSSGFNLGKIHGPHVDERWTMRLGFV